MWRSNVGSAQTRPETSKTDRGQVRQNAVEEESRFKLPTIAGNVLAGSESSDILEECKPGTNVPKYADAVSPQIAVVCAGESLSGVTVRLARKSTSDDKRELTASLKD